MAAHPRVNGSGHKAQNGKGDKPRPKSVSADEFADNWHATFKNPCKFPDCTCPAKTNCKKKS